MDDEPINESWFKATTHGPIRSLVKRGFQKSEHAVLGFFAQHHPDQAVHVKKIFSGEFVRTLYGIFGL